MPGRGGKRRRGQGKVGRGGGRGGSRGRGRPTKRKRKSAPVEPEKERPAVQEEDSSEDESSDEEVRPTAYQRLVQSSRRDLQPVAAPAATSTEHAGAKKALADAAAGHATGGGDTSHAGSEDDPDAGDSGDDSSSSSDDDDNSSDDDDNATGGNARLPAAAADSTEERHADKRDSFRRIFFGEELREAEYARQRQAVTDARLRPQAMAGCLHVESTVAEAPAVHRKLSDNLVRSSIRARFSVLAGRSRLTEEEASVYSYLRSYCDVFHAACTHKSAENWERLTMVHVLNHVLR